MPTTQVADCKSTARRNAGALLLLAIAGLLNACGGGGGEPELAQGSDSATLAWDAVTGAIGYRVYVGTESGTYSQVVDTGNVTTYTATGLNSATTTYFVATAYDSSNNESVFSNEVFKAIP